MLKSKCTRNHCICDHRKPERSILFDRLISAFIPNGRTFGNVYVAPRRKNQPQRLIVLDLDSGEWTAVHIEAQGRDVTSLAEYLFDMHRADATGLIRAVLDIEGRAPRDEANPPIAERLVTAESFDADGEEDDA